MTDKPIVIRPATEADLPVLLEFEQGVVDAERPYIERIGDGHVYYYDLPELIRSDQSLVLLAEAGGQPVGTGHASIRKSLHYLAHKHHAYLGLMYVVPAFRGTGVVQQIMEDLLDWARCRGIVDFSLNVFSRNEQAIRAYEKFGFRPNMVEMKLHDPGD